MWGDETERRKCQVYDIKDSLDYQTRNVKLIDSIRPSREVQTCISESEIFVKQISQTCMHPLQCTNKYGKKFKTGEKDIIYTAVGCKELPICMYGDFMISVGPISKNVLNTKGEFKAVPRDASEVIYRIYYTGKKDVTTLKITHHDKYLSVTSNNLSWKTLNNDEGYEWVADETKSVGNLFTVPSLRHECQKIDWKPK